MRRRTDPFLIPLMEGPILLGGRSGDVENWWMSVHDLWAIYGTVPIGPVNTAPAG